MQNETKARNGARKVIDTCLGLTRGQELLVLFDETTRNVANLLLEAACEIAIDATAIYVPVLLQKQLGTRRSFPLAMHRAIREATGIVTCLTDDQACLTFRAKVLDIGLNNRSKIGHMPGMTMDILAMADADYQQISADCEILAVAMLRGKRLELISHDSQGNAHRLSADIGGWDRPPAVSDGLLKRGGWANIPPGEVFIAPLEGTACGTVVINGSLPGYVIPTGGEICLEFENGRLVDFHSANPRAVEIVRGLRDFALERDDPNWDNLAEIGLGVNTAVKHLTGIELLDEKKYGTAHIALGENSWFGGATSSTIHSDLIILKPTVLIDGQTVTLEGHIQTTLADWQEDHRQIELDSAWRSSFSHLSRSGIRGDRGTWTLRREWISGRGVTRYIQVGATSSAQKGAHLYAQIPQFGTLIEMKSLVAQNRDWDEDEIYQLVRLMHMYELLTLVDMQSRE